MSIQMRLQKKLGNFVLDMDFKSSDHRIGILGASGCGKSMTLKAIAGIATPDEGKLVIDDKTLYQSSEKINIKPQQRNIGYLFQNYALFPNMNVEENIAAGIKIKDRQKKKELVNSMMERFQLDCLGKRLPTELSGGQQQRVALARIMAYEPDVILLDEPFSALDGYLKDILQQDMIKFLKDYEGYVIFVSHNRDEIYKFCSTLLVMENGILIEQGSTKDVFIKPLRKYTAQLTGCKNISEIEKREETVIYAKDWNLCLETMEPVKDTVKYVGIRAHDILPAYQKGQNTARMQLEDMSEAPFEIQYLLKAENAAKQSIWWKVPKTIQNTLHQK